MSIFPLWMIHSLDREAEHLGWHDGEGPIAQHIKKQAVGINSQSPFQMLKGRKP